MFIISYVSLVFAQQPLSTVYYSVDETDLQLLFRSEANDQVLYHDGSQVSATGSTPYYDYPDWFRASLPNPAHGYIGFRSEADGIRLNPVFWDVYAGNDVSAFSLMTTDPTGDQNFSNVNLDLTALYVTFTADRIYFALQNSGGGFPVSSGFTNFSYMAIMVNPNADPNDNPPVYGLMYTLTLPGVISPGLYKITGTGFSDLQRIGDIVSSVDTANNTLYLSCARSALVSDADFMSWYDPDYPLVGSMAITSRITLTGGTQEADSTPAGNILFLPQEANRANLQQPALTNAVIDFTDEPYGAAFSIEYSDQDHNFPLYSKVYLDGIYHSELLPEGTLSFDTSQLYTGNIPALPPLGEWSVIELRFSDDNQSFVSHYFHAPVSYSVETLAPPVIQLYPNPSSSIINLIIPKKAKAQKIGLFNLRGQRVMSWMPGEPNQKGEYSLDVSNLSPGMYLLECAGIRKTFVKVE